jgi:hypothetical protein
MNYKERWYRHGLQIRASGGEAPMHWVEAPIHWEEAPMHWVEAC